MGRAAVLLALSLGVMPSTLWASRESEVFARVASPEIEVIPTERCNERAYPDMFSLQALLAKSAISQTDPIRTLVDEGVLTEDLRINQSSIEDGPKPIFKSGTFSWVPSGANDYANKAECSADTIEKALYDRRDDRAARATYVTHFMSKCDSYLSRHNFSMWVGLLALEKVDYNFCDNPRVRRVMVTLPNGRKWMAWLGLKPDGHPRPLVIVKCGIFCNPGGASQRFMMSHFFDESPFNVLVIANGTGNQFIRDNHTFAFGGVDDGVDLIKIAELIRDPHSTLHPFASSVHVAAVSLGGHAALYSALYNTHMRPQGSDPLLNSIMAICPVVNLQETIDDDLQDGSLKSRAMSVIAWQNLVAAREFIPWINELLGSDRWPSNPSILPPLFAKIAVIDYSRRDPRWSLPPLLPIKATSDHQFWDYNRFDDYAQQNQTPVFIWASDDDPIVSYNINTSSLVDKHLANYTQATIQASTAPHGGHCAFSTIYSWDLASAVLRATVLAEAKEFNLSPRKVKLRSNWLPYDAKLTRGERYYNQIYKVEPGEGFVRLRLDTFDANKSTFFGTQCGRLDLSASDPGDRCLRTINARIGFGELGLPTNPARTEVEAQAMTRWANANLRLTDEANRGLESLQAPPAMILVRGDY